MAFSAVRISSTRNGITPITGYRDDLATSDTVVCSLTSTLGVSTFKWEMVGRPEGSAAGGAGPEPVLLSTSATCTFTVDDDSSMRRDGTYLVRCTVNAGTSTETQIEVILARLSGLTLAGGRTLRKPAAFETLGLDTSVANTNEGWAIQFLRWLEYVRTQAGGSGANTNLTYITKANETGSLPNSIGLATLSGPGLLKFANDGTPSKAVAGTDYQAPLSAADASIEFPTTTTVRAGSYSLVTRATAAGHNMFNLGGLATGLVWIDVAGAIATPRTAVPGTDYLVGGGAAGGDLAGTYPNPTVIAAEWSGTRLTFGALADGAIPKRSGTTLIGATPGTDYQAPMSPADASIVFPSATTVTRGALTGDVTAPQGSNVTKVVAVHETGGPTQLTLGAVPDGEFLQRSGTSLIGALIPAASTTGLVANWPLTTTRTFLYDPVNGNDANPGFSDGAGPYNPATQAKQSEAALQSIFPGVFNGRSFRILYAAGTYATSWIGDLLSGIHGYGTSVVRATATGATASATAFADDANDRIFSGFTTATNAFASGYNPTGSLSTTTIQLVKVGGGGPAFVAEPASPLGYRVRFGSTTATVALRNATSTIIKVSGTDTVVLGEALPATPSTSDVLYVEMPTTVFSSATTIGGLGAGVGAISIVGARFTGGLTLEGPGDIAFTGCGAQSLFTSTADSIVSGPSYLEPGAGGTINVRGALRVETTTTITSVLGTGSFASSVFAGAATVTGKPLSLTLTNVVFGAGLNLNRGVGTAARLFNGASRIIGVSGSAGLNITGGEVFVGNVDVSTSGHGVFVGDNAYVHVDVGLTGTNSGWGLTIAGAVGAVVNVFSTVPTISGTAGAIGLSDNTTISWANVVAGGIQDVAGNKLVYPAGNNFAFTALPGAMKLLGGSLTVPSLVGPGHLQVNGSGLFSVDAATYLADPGGNGIVVRTGSGTTVARTLTSSGGTITVTNGSGVAGNPNVDLPNVGPGAGLIGGSGIASVTLDAQGRVTAAATATYLTSVSGTAGGDLTGSYPNPTIATNAVTNAKFRQSVGLSVVGNSTNSLANVADIVATTTGQVLQCTGSTIGFAALAYSALTGAPTIFYQTVSNAGTSLAQQPILNFDGTVVASAGTGKTNVGLPVQGGLTPATYTFATVTVDAYGRVTAASNGSVAPTNATFIVQTPNGSLSNAQALSALATGILKSTTTTGVVSTAVAGTDYEVPLTFNTGLTRSTNTVTWTNAAATYLVASSTSAPGSAVNLGALGSGFVKSSVSIGVATISIDTNTYLTTASAASTYEPIFALTNKSVIVSTGGSGVTEDNANFQYNTASHALTAHHLVIPSADGSQVAINLNQAADQAIQKGTGALFVGTVDAHALNLFTGNTNRLVIDSGGGVTLSSLSSGIVKATSGLLSIASAGTDYQAAGSYITALTGDVTASGPGSASATVVALHETGGPTKLTIGAVPDGSVLARRGSTLVGVEGQAQLNFDLEGVNPISFSGYMSTGSTSILTAAQPAYPLGMAPIQARILVFVTQNNLVGTTDVVSITLFQAVSPYSSYTNQASVSFLSTTAAQSLAADSGWGGAFGTTHDTDVWSARISSTGGSYVSGSMSLSIVILFR